MAETECLEDIVKERSIAAPWTWSFRFRSTGTNVSLNSGKFWLIASLRLSRRVMLFENPLKQVGELLHIAELAKLGA